MSYGHDEPEQTWDDGRLDDDSVIEAADGTGYTSMSDYVDDIHGYDPDPLDDDDN